MRLLSVNVGLPRELPWRGGTVRTAIFKAPVDGRRRVRRLNVDGDGQADLVGHGGEHRAVYVYVRSAFDHWAEFLALSNRRILADQMQFLKTQFNSHKRLLSFQ